MKGRQGRGSCSGRLSRSLLAFHSELAVKKKSMEPLESVLLLDTTLRLFCRCSKPQLDPFISTLPPSGFPLFLLHHPAFSSSSSSIHFSPSFASIHFSSFSSSSSFTSHSSPLSSIHLFLFTSLPSPLFLHHFPIIIHLHLFSLSFIHAIISLLLFPSSSSLYLPCSFFLYSSILLLLPVFFLNPSFIPHLPPLPPTAATRSWMDPGTPSRGFSVRLNSMNNHRPASCFLL